MYEEIRKWLNASELKYMNEILSLESFSSAFYRPLTKVVKVGKNSWVNLIHHGYGPGWVKIFLQMLVRINFWPDSPRTRLTRVESVVSRVGPPTRMVTHIMLGFAMFCFF